jgi:hypothetical protein
VADSGTAAGESGSYQEGGMRISSDEPDGGPVISVGLGCGPDLEVGVDSVTQPKRAHPLYELFYF